jgi:hypothetical protein
MRVEQLIRGLVISAVVLLPAAVTAQTTFYEAYATGIEHEQAARWERARTAFEAAARLHPEPERRIKTYGLNFLHGYDPYLHLARAQIHLGILDEAESNLQRSAAAGVSSPDEIEALRAELERARSRTEPAPTIVTAAPIAEPVMTPTATPTPPTLLVLQSAPAGAEVFVDGRLVGVTPVELPVAAGQHRIELRSTGFLPYREMVTVPAAETVERRLTLRPVPSPTVSSAVREPTIRPTVVATPTSIPVPQAAAAKPTVAEPLLRPAEIAATPTPRAELSAKGPASGLRRHRAVLVAGVAGAALLALTIWIVMRRGRKPSRQPSAHTLTPTRRLEGSYTAPPTATPLPDTMPPAFGSYRLRMVLGHGGMATTYLAERTRDRAAVAIKVPHEHLLGDPEFVERFVREGALGATIHHPNIIRIYEAGRLKGKPFIAMEFLDGITLEQKLAETGALPVRESLEIARGIALALDYAHVKGTIHRDLKPENVMLLANGGVKVMDFGIARVADAPALTATNAYLGTPLYSAPECLNAADVDQRSDLYTLGIIMYRMLTNRLPFESSSPLQLFEMHRDKPLPPFPRELAIPDAVVKIVVRLTAKAKNDRCPSAEVLLRELNGILNEL